MQKTYPLRALVLRRTKLGESDVICTLLSEDGSQVRAVAKGARKPTSTFASRLEVYAICDLLLVHGKSLDLIKEARLVEGNQHLRSDIAYMEAAAPMVELLDRATQVGLQDARLFAMTSKALGLLKDAAPDELSKFTCAHLLKTLAILGFRPSFDTCVVCGVPFEGSVEGAGETMHEGASTGAHEGEVVVQHDGTHVGVQENASVSRGITSTAVGSGLSVPFSLIDGGVVCSGCLMQTETIMLQHDVVAWSQSMLYSTFEAIQAMEPSGSTLYAILRFLQLWVRQHVGVNLKSLNYLITY